MENKMDIFCSLCLSTIWDSIEHLGETTKEAVDIIFLNNCLPLVKGQVICQNCSRLITFAFEFKCSCIYVEDCLVSSIAASGTTPIDLFDVYLRKNGTAGISDNDRNKKVCRLCLRLIQGSFTSLLDEAELDMMQKFMPEIALQNTVDPVACQTCTASLFNVTTFITDCLNSQKKRNQNASAQNTSNSEIINQVEIVKKSIMNVKNCEINLENYDENVEPFNITDSFVKSQQGTYTESAQLSYLTSFLNKEKAKPMEIESLNYDPYQSTSLHTTFTGSYQADSFLVQENLNGTGKPEIDIEGHKSNFLYDLDLQMVKCDELNAKKSEKDTYQKRDCRRSKRKCAKKLKDISKTKTHECIVCGYNTQYLNALKSHMLSHKSRPELQLHRCQHCEYRTKYRSALKSHELNHKLPSEIKMRKCNVCSYETKHRTALVLHMLKHKSIDEIEMYRCDKCNFQTKFKHALKPHKKKHKDGK